ncbi:hypothetical protein [Diaphorobacter caeni]|uniref:hypothetical protein n=1 Tax=Diaphorobacter caeni TaxID=2784387 RepID=UPI00188FB180|nr:hypothetical protein [Diaphorobacter caeni]MBF5003103.1 hypothetical protein [Diaphorobacter caeni]
MLQRYGRGNAFKESTMDFTPMTAQSKHYGGSLMLNLNCVLWLAVLLPLASHAQSNNDCPGKRSLEISGQYTVPSEITWNTVEIPDAIMLDASAFKHHDQPGIASVAQKYAFQKPERIKAYFVDDESRAGVHYDTEIGQIFLVKMLHNKSKFKACVPSSAMNSRLNGLPAALDFDIAATDKSKCMWGMTVFGLHDEADYSFYKPTSCSSTANKADLNKMLEFFKTLMPKSAFSR